MALTLSLWNIASINSESDITLLQVFAWVQKVFLVQFIEHFFSAIFHHLF